MASALLALLGTFVMVVETEAGILQFGQMVKYMTGRPPLNSYAFYGCYCGLGGSGWPVDEIDWCCHIHDCCYDVLLRMGCSPLYQPYQFSRINGIITCDDEDFYGCARQSCECDRAASFCFQEFDAQYSIKNNGNFYRTKCWGIQPSCKRRDRVDLENVQSV